VNSDIYILKSQYEWVKQSRKILFKYCSTIIDTDLLKENSTFSRGSIRNLLVHIANTYEFWIGNRYLNKEISFTKYESIVTINDVKSLFSEVDALVAEFLNDMVKHDRNEIEIEYKGEKMLVEPFKLFTHVITHEFHHKGQILSFSRHLGYTPVDTDIMR